jgi:hypothetical protein
MLIFKKCGKENENENGGKILEERKPGEYYPVQEFYSGSLIYIMCCLLPGFPSYHHKRGA